MKPKQEQLVIDQLLEETINKLPPKVIEDFDKNFNKNFKKNFDENFDEYSDKNFDENFIKKPENQTVDIRLMWFIVVCFAAFVLRLHFCISACSARQGKSPAESTAAE